MICRSTCAPTKVAVRAAFDGIRHSLDLSMEGVRRSSAEGTALPVSLPISPSSFPGKASKQRERESMPYFRTSTRSTCFLLAGATVTVVALLSVGGYGYAALASPTTPTVYTGCLKAGQISKVAVGTTPTSRCVSPAVQISWSKAGPQGASVISVALGVGNAKCPTGGSSFTVGSSTTYACNGAKGDAGVNGTNGTNGLNGTNGTNGINGINGVNGTSISSAPLFLGSPYCPTGGTLFTSISGLTTACNGAGVISSALNVGDANCPAGGSSFLALGPSATYACNGTNGTNGTDGTSVTSSALGVGDANCPNGGSSFTSASGTTYACTGTVRAQSCQAGGSVTGFDANGNAICHNVGSVTGVQFDSTSTVSFPAPDPGGLTYIHPFAVSPALDVPAGAAVAISGTMTVHDNGSGIAKATCFTIASSAGQVGSLSGGGDEARSFDINLSSGQTTSIDLTSLDVIGSSVENLLYVNIQCFPRQDALDGTLEFSDIHLQGISVTSGAENSG
jgi:hypothetical protein